MFGIFTTLTIVFALICGSTALAVGPPDYLPDGSHPRIWLNSTELSRLRAAKNANSVEWQALNTWLSDNYPSTNYNVRVPNATYPGYRSVNWDGHTWASYRGLGWLEVITNYALAYQILKESNPTLAEQYGNHCIDIVNGMIQTHSVGEETDNGILMMRAGDGSYNLTNNAAEVSAATSAGETIMPTYRAGKYGYPARAMIALPLAYDWLFPLLSTENKALWQNVMFRYFDWVRGKTSSYNDGVVYGGVRYHEQSDGVCNGTTDVCTSVTTSYQQGATFNDNGDNFWSGFFEMMMLTGLATYGDTPDAAEYFSYAKNTMWQNKLLPSWNSTAGYKGGDAPEGWNYGAGWFRDFEALIGLKTATGYNPFDDTDFPREVIKSYINATSSNLKDMYPHGQWSGSLVGKPYKYHAFVAAAADLEDGGAYAPYAQWFLDNATFAPNTSGGTWEKLIFYRPVTAQNPRDVFPTYYKNDASGLVAMRSSWTTAPDTISSWWQLGKGTRNTHENYDEGHFAVMRGDDKLLWDDGTTREYYRNSVIDFGGTGQIAIGTDWTVAESITGMVDTSSYLFVSANLVGGYQKNYYPSKRSDLFQRRLLYLKPNIWVISDITHTDATVANKWKDWNAVFPGVPTANIDTKTVTFTSGSSKVFVKTVYPTEIGYTVEPSYSTLNYRSKMRPTVVNEYDQFLHVIEATGSSSNQTQATLITGNGGRGALVGTTAVMFTSDQTGANITDISYTVDATTHFICDLPQNTMVDITRGGFTVTGSPFNSGDAGIIMFFASGGDAIYAISIGKAVKPPPKIIDIQKIPLNQ